MQAQERQRQAELKQQLEQQLASQQVVHQQHPSRADHRRRHRLRPHRLPVSAAWWVSRCGTSEHPYVWGGASPSGFDCSGFTMYVYAQVGVSLPHNAATQYGMGVAVSRGDLQPGDLVFFYGLGHVGLYIGGGSFIHAPHTGDVVKISSLSGSYASSYVGARRIT